MRRICVVPRVSGVGGMVSFQARLAAGLAQRGVQMCTDLADTPYDAVLVIGGTRDLPGLWRARRRGVHIVQRLNGMNWLHRRLRTGLRHFLRAEYGNWLLSFIRSRLVTGVIYQSQFAHAWWERVYGPTRTSWGVIYNGVDLSQYNPCGTGERPVDHSRLLVVEGSLGGGYEMGLETAVALAESVAQAQQRKVELMVVGRAAPSLQAHWQQKLSASPVFLIFQGEVARERIPEIDRSAHLLYAADLNAACPNSVVEALACGLPVVAFDTGALPELVRGEAGRVVEYGGNPWRLEAPNLSTLAGAALEVLGDQPLFRAGARNWAEVTFGVDRMVDAYLEMLTVAE
ncbi:MAG: glycosyltransferase family 4 protein [Anaerolineales bacterium]|nr:glycosyltransferase family 4 protein [Anaerolineales bacterium]